MISREEFQKFANSLITEEDKTEIKSRRILFLVLGLIFMTLTLIFVILTFISGINGLYYLGFSIIFLTVSLIFLCGGKGFAYSRVLNKYKPLIIEFLLKKYKYAYNAKGYLGKDLYAQFNLPMYYDTYSGEDYIALNIPKDDGTQSTTDLQISQIKTSQHYKDKDGNIKERTIYSGTLGIVTFDFHFPCYLALGKNYFGWQVKEEKMETEDTEFNKNFKTYTDNELEAFRILTPDLMLKMIDIHRKLKYIDFVFKENKLLIYMPNKDLFAIKGHKDGYEKSFELIYNDIEALIEIIKEIQTNNKVFKF